MIKKEDYSTELQNFISNIKQFNQDQIFPHALECLFESLSDRSVFHSISDVRSWFLSKKANSRLHVENISLKDMNDWLVDDKTGNIQHKSNDFFVVRGIRVTTNTREKGGGWDQPILEQVGYDGGLLGLIRKRFHGIPHYLCEAKEEPGNYGKVQISPSLQATFANLNQAHGGRKPRFSELFIDRNTNKFVKVLFESWLAEDGGRLHLKRNKGILLEVDEDYDLEIPNDNFIWLSLYQIKTLLKEDAWINPHIRGILAHV
ncbi:NDP-hexose 2,3-dehydratase family protein [Gammaproteobacteria bacterium]|nr:NDP-hexose 2,3-dehydratase family protein [Gammaproteobacteria bacterium]